MRIARALLLIAALAALLPSSLLRAQQQDGRHGSAIWTLLSFAVWHRIFVEGGGEKPADQSDPLAFIA